jgi:hypothetical protein
LRHSTGWDVDLGEMDLSLLSGLSLTVSPVRLGAPQGGPAAASILIFLRRSRAGCDLRSAIRRKISEERSSISGLAALLGVQEPEEAVKGFLKKLLD